MDLLKLKKNIKFLDNDILNYANTNLGIYTKHYLKVDELIIDLEYRKQIEDKEFKIHNEKKNSEFKDKSITNECNIIYQKLGDMIKQWQKLRKQYQKEKIKITELKKKIEIEEAELPEIKMLELLTQEKNPSLRKWIKNRYVCINSLEMFVKEYCLLAKDLVQATNEIASEGKVITKKLEYLSKIACETPIPLLKPGLIRDYIVNDVDHKKYSKKAIDKVITEYRFDWI